MIVHPHIFCTSGTSIGRWFIFYRSFSRHPSNLRTSSYMFIFNVHRFIFITSGMAMAMLVLVHFVDLRHGQLIVGWIVPIEWTNLIDFYRRSFAAFYFCCILLRLDVHLMVSQVHFCTRTGRQVQVQVDLLVHLFIQSSFWWPDGTSYIRSTGANAQKATWRTLVFSGGTVVVLQPNSSTSLGKYIVNNGVHEYLCTYVHISFCQSLSYIDDDDLSIFLYIFLHPSVALHVQIESLSSIVHRHRTGILADGIAIFLHGSVGPSSNGILHGPDWLSCIFCTSGSSTAMASPLYKWLIMIEMANIGLRTWSYSCIGSFALNNDLTSYSRSFDILIF